MSPASYQLLYHAKSGNKKPGAMAGFFLVSPTHAGMTGWVNNATWRHDIASPFEGLLAIPYRINVI